MHKSFSFKGLNRSGDVSLAADGECMDVVNLRMNNGVLQPMPALGQVAELETEYFAIYWHPHTKHYLCVVNDSERGVHFYDAEWKRVVLEFPQLNGVEGVEFLGNIACCLTQRGMRYLLFNSGSYIWLGERPSVPVFTVELESKVQSVTTENEFVSSGYDVDEESTWGYNEKGFVDECIHLLNKEGYYIDRTLFRVALRLFDGTYINCSNVIYLCDNTFDKGVGRDARNMLSKALDTSTTSSKYTVSVRGFKVKFKLDCSALQAWRNIVVGVDVFSTPSIPGNGISLVGRARQLEGYAFKGVEKLYEEVAGASLFYKVAEFDIDGNVLSELGDVSDVNLALQQMLDAGDMPASLNSIAAGCSYVYNNRLHVASLREILFCGYGAGMLFSCGAAVREADYVCICTKLSTTGGDEVVVRRIDKPSLCWNGYEVELPPFLSYPDTRATEMRVYISMGGVIYRKAFKLTPHRYLNVAYYLHKWYLPYTVLVNAVFANGGDVASVADDYVLEIFENKVGVHEVIYNSSMKCWTYNGKSFPPAQYASHRIFAVPRDVTNGDKIVFSIVREVSNFSFKDINNIPVDATWGIVDTLPDVEPGAFEVRPNVLKVSLVDNPFVFPAKNTYSPSQAEIVAICGNTSVVSQGQFGQFPLYLFCADGIWAMSVDSSGTMAYVASHQLSREGCCSRSSVCAIGGGVVFLGRQGMMLVTGSSVKEFSKAVDGDASPILRQGLMKLQQIAALVSLSKCVRVKDFYGYAKEAAVIYSPAHNEIIISNDAFPYSYVYSLESHTWGLFSGKVSGGVYGAFELLMFERCNAGTCIVKFSEERSGDNNVLLYTRPQIWGTKLPKRVMQLLLHAYASMPKTLPEGVPLLACYLLCSNDGASFKLVSGCEKYERLQDVRFPYFPTQAYKYFVVAIVGRLGANSAISAIELDINAAWNNRLR